MTQEFIRHIPAWPTLRATSESQGRYKGREGRVNVLSENESRSTRNAILSGISAELRETATHGDFKIERMEKDGHYWKVFVEVTRMNKIGLDESLEGAVAWWAGPPKGAADVLSVIPDQQQINLRYATTQPPSPGQLIRIFPPQYLNALYDCWQDSELANRSINWEYQPDSCDPQDKPLSIPPKFMWLRPAQKAAFGLARWKAAFLWGPPGTGKTTTVGALLATYLQQNPNSRVLLLSTTNTAVDIAIQSVDKSFERLESNSASTAATRRSCFRIGNHFRPQNYVGREHLIPIKDGSLISKLVAIEARRPDSENVQAFGQWRAELEAMQQFIRKQAIGVIEQCRLAAMTTALAVYWLKQLIAMDFDLIVFDEASQIGKAYALLIAQCTKNAIFAGDPKQLSPIVKSEHGDAKEWIGTSMFAFMERDKESVCFLDEQSRMAGPICHVVSNVFYDGRLRVADDALRDDAWYRSRELVGTATLSDRHVCVVPVTGNGQWSAKYHGPIRFESAQLINRLANELVRGASESEIVVLTPFRAQRTLIRTFLRNGGLKKVDVSTVHRAQGSERKIVIFDPVQGDSEFLKGGEAKRLINVAMSRAKSRLIMLISPSDQANSLFASIATAISNVDLLGEVRDIHGFIAQPSFPQCMKGLVVRLKTVVGRVERVASSGANFEVRCLLTDRLHTIQTEWIRQKFN